MANRGPPVSPAALRVSRGDVTPHCWSLSRTCLSVASLSCKAGVSESSPRLGGSSLARARRVLAEAAEPAVVPGAVVGVAPDAVEGEDAVVTDGVTCALGASPDADEGETR